MTAAQEATEDLAAEEATGAATKLASDALAPRLLVIIGASLVFGGDSPTAATQALSSQLSSCYCSVGLPLQSVSYLANPEQRSVIGLRCH